MQTPVRHCAKSETCTKILSDARILQLWEAPDTGLLVSERLINCPPQLAPPLQQALFDEVSWAIDDEPTQAGFPPQIIILHK